MTVNTNVADQIINENLVQVNALRRGLYTALTVLGLVHVAVFCALGIVNGLTVLIVLATVLAAYMTLKAHDQYKIARARLGA